MVQNLPIDEEEFCKEVKNLLQNIMGNLALDPDLSVQINDVNIVPKYSIRFGTWYRLIHVKVFTNNRPLLLGQIDPFEPGQLEGFFPNYVLGYFDSYLVAHYGIDAVSQYQLHLDVYQDPSFEEHYPSKSISLSEAVEQGVLGGQSKLAVTMKNYDIEFLKICGSEIIGPVPDMIKALEILLKDQNIVRVLDLFCGTGALSKVALAHGASQVTSLDLDISVAIRNLGDLPFYDLVEMDIFQWVPKGKYDLCIVDAPYALGRKFAENKIKEIANDCPIILFDIGLKEDGYWCEYILSVLHNFVNVVSPRYFEESVIALLSNEESNICQQIWKES